MATRPPLPPKPYRFDPYGIGLSLPAAWKPIEEKTPSVGAGVFPAGNGVLLKIAQPGTTLYGELCWLTGGISLETVLDGVVATLTAHYREVNVRKKQPFLDTGFRLEVRVSNDPSITLIMSYGVWFHRGRIYSLMFLSHQGERHKFREEIESVFMSVRLAGPPEGIYALNRQVEPQTARSKKYEYEIEVPSGWMFEESSADEPIIVGRLWSAGGIPCVHIMVATSPKTPFRSHVDALLSQLSPEQKPEVLERDRSGKMDTVIYAQTIGRVRYQTVFRAIDQGSNILSFMACLPATEYSQFKEVFLRMLSTLRDIPE
jgi:hypothetical protein